MLRVALVTILAREMRLKFFEVDQRLEMLRVPLVTILAREMRLKVFFNYVWCQTANNVTSRARKISLKFVEKMSIFNRMYRANIVTSGCSTSKACFVKKLSIAFLAPTSWFAAFAPHSFRGLHVSIAYPAPISWQKRPCSQSHVKHVSVSTAMAFKASDRQHHAVEFIRNPMSSYFHSQVFIFMRLSSLALPWIAIFTRKCDCHAMVNSLAIARIAISIRNLRLSSLRLYELRRYFASRTRTRLDLNSCVGDGFRLLSLDTLSSTYFFSFPTPFANRKYARQQPTSIVNLRAQEPCCLFFRKPSQLWTLNKQPLPYHYFKKWIESLQTNDRQMTRKNFLRSSSQSLIGPLRPEQSSGSAAAPRLPQQQQVPVPSSYPDRCRTVLAIPWWKKNLSNFKTRSGDVALCFFFVWSSCQFFYSSIFVSDNWENFPDFRSSLKLEFNYCNDDVPILKWWPFYFYCRPHQRSTGALAQRQTQAVQEVPGQFHLLNNPWWASSASEMRLFA